MHILTCLTFMAIFYGVCIFGICCDGGAQRVKNLYCDFSFLEKIVLRVAIIFIMCFVFYWVKQDRFVYFWDYAIYWKQSIHRMEYIFSHSFLQTINSIHDSINHSSYNDFLPCVIALPMRVLGYTHAKYVFINFAMFFVPTVLVQGLLAVKICESKATTIPSTAVYIIGILVAILFQGNYYAGLRGFIDIGFLLPASVAVYLFLDYDFNRISISRNLAISFTLLTAWISRRYVVYFAIGYVTAMLVKAAYSLIFGGKWKETILNFAIIGGVSLVILLAFFRSFFLDALLTNYGYKYSAYDAPLSNKLNAVFLSFGIVTFVILAIIGVLCFVKKRNRINFVCMCAFLISSTYMFWRTQRMDTQHRMLLNLPVFVCFLFLLTLWEDNFANHIRRLLQNAMVILCISLQLLNFVKVFVPSVPNDNSYFFAEKYYPSQRNDIDQLWQLASTLNSLTEGTSDSVYIVASSPILNDSILRCLNAPYTETSVPNMVHNRDVDLRDGFPPEFLTAKYVVTTTPVQTHLSSGQYVITYLADCLHDSSNYLGRHFKKVYEVELDNNVTAEVYEKCSSFTEDDLTKLREYYNTLYPNDTELFADRIK